ncbi:hypothetical protein [Flavobacterium sp.]|uniref:hypothetical protein n=1 Tax=Flavobacterium sp. TaxID=239 RepID=UPI003D6B0D8A
MFVKETFIATIDVLQKQYEYDLSYATLLERVINAEGIPPYDNSHLTNHLFTLLQNQFPPLNGQCEIERFCYELHFGFFGGKAVLTAEDLWDSLHSSERLVYPEG